MGGGPALKRDYLNKYTVKESGMVEWTNTDLYRRFVAMREEILKHKWLESEKVHHDVGFEYALVDWMIRHKAEWDKKTKPNQN